MINQDDIKRFNSKYKINPDNGCWEWQGFTGTKYGKFSTGSRVDKSRVNVRAHRFSYTVFKGEIKDGLWVLHKCDNPKCVNPDHLFLGTMQDNVDDREKKGRNKYPIGEQSPHAKLTTEQVANIRFDIKSGMSRKEILAKYPVSKSSYKDIWRGRTWKHVTPSPPVNKQD